jgi:transcriptional regulator with XRE-family HTH domain
MDIGRAIKTIRYGLKLSQNQLAHDMGISQTCLSQIENGAKQPSSKTLVKLAVAIDIPLDLVYLLAITELDVCESKLANYRAIHPSIANLIIQMIMSARSMAARVPGSAQEK